jgi:hypothetical protein
MQVCVSTEQALRSVVAEASDPYWEALLQGTKLGECLTVARNFLNGTKPAFVPTDKDGDTYGNFPDKKWAEEAAQKLPGGYVQTVWILVDLPYNMGNDPS